MATPQPKKTDSHLPLFVPDELLLFLDAAGARDQQALMDVEEVLAPYGGSVPSLLERSDETTVIPSEQPLQMLKAEGLKWSDTDEALQGLVDIDEKLAARDSTVIWNPNWIAGASPMDWTNGSGGGPGARPRPLGPDWHKQPLPLRDSLVRPLREATQPEHKVRLVFLDAWNADASETERLRPLYRYLNRYCLNDDFRLQDDFYASRDGDPFPMPDHGLFAAWLAGSIIGENRLCLHDSLVQRLSPEESDALAAPAANACVSLESVRVLDGYGVGDTGRIIDALAQIADSIQPDERVIVNLSLFVKIPDLSWIHPPIRLMFDGRWPWQGDDPQRLDRGLHAAVRALYDKGALLVAAAGNDSEGPRERRPRRYPAAYSEVLAVTAARIAGGQEAWYANEVGERGVAVYAGDVDPYGNLDPDYPLAGPFTDSHVPIPGAFNDPENRNGGVAWAGTSFATPMVSGLAALLWSANPDLAPDQLRDRIRNLSNGRRLQSGTPFIDLFEY